MFPSGIVNSTPWGFPVGKQWWGRRLSVGFATLNATATNGLSLRENHDFLPSCTGQASTQSY